MYHVGFPNSLCVCIRMPDSMLHWNDCVVLYWDFSDTVCCVILGFCRVCCYKSFNEIEYACMLCLYLLGSETVCCVTIFSFQLVCAGFLSGGGRACFVFSVSCVDVECCVAASVTLCSPPLYMNHQEKRERNVSKCH